MLDDRSAEHDKVIVDKYDDPTGDFSMTTRDYVLRPSAGPSTLRAPVTITLPPVSEAKGRIYSILARYADVTNTITITDKGDSEYWSGDYPLIVSGQNYMFYSDGLHWKNMSETIGVLSIKTVMTAAEVLTLRAVPITIVPALGATKLIEFISATLELGYGSNVFAESSANLEINYKDGAGVTVSVDVEATGFLDQTADTLTRAIPIKDAIAASTAAINQPLVLHNTGAAEFSGNAALDNTLTIWTLFRVIETG
jgi:hypothetical protein